MVRLQVNQNWCRTGSESLFDSEPQMLLWFCLVPSSGARLFSSVGPTSCSVWFEQRLGWYGSNNVLFGSNNVLFDTVQTTSCSVRTMSCSVRTMSCSVRTMSCSVRTMSCSVLFVISIIMVAWCSTWS